MVLPERLEGYWNRGIGKPNFVGAWEIDGTTVDYNDDFDERINVALVPYSSTPPRSLESLLKDTWSLPSHLRYGSLFTHKINDILGGIWTLPPDWRLDFNFQYHVFWQARTLERKEQDIIELAKMIRQEQEKVKAAGGSYTVTEIDSRGNFVTFDVLEAPSALEVEEWCLDIPPKLFWTTTNGLPITISNLSSGRQPPASNDEMSWTRAV
jgi:hypothetical protein